MSSNVRGTSPFTPLQNAIPSQNDNAVTKAPGRLDSARSTKATETVLHDPSALHQSNTLASQLSDALPSARSFDESSHTLHQYKQLATEDHLSEALDQLAQKPQKFNFKTQIASSFSAVKSSSKNLLQKLHKPIHESKLSQATQMAYTTAKAEKRQSRIDSLKLNAKSALDMAKPILMSSAGGAALLSALTALLQLTMRTAAQPAGEESEAFSEESTAVDSNFLAQAQTAVEATLSELPAEIQDNLRSEFEAQFAAVPEESKSLFLQGFAENYLTGCVDAVYDDPSNQVAHYDPNQQVAYGSLSSETIEAIFESSLGQASQGALQAALSPPTPTESASVQQASYVATAAVIGGAAGALWSAIHLKKQRGVATQYLYNLKRLENLKQATTPETKQLKATLEQTNHQLESLHGKLLSQVKLSYEAYQTHQLARQAYAPVKQQAQRETRTALNQSKLEAAQANEPGKIKASALAVKTALKSASESTQARFKTAVNKAKGSIHQAATQVKQKVDSARSSVSEVIAPNNQSTIASKNSHGNPASELSNH